MRNLILSLLFGVLIVSVGCAHFSGTEYSENEYPNSYIVKVCKANDWKPEALGGNIVDISFMGIGSGFFEKENVQNFIDGYKKTLDTEISYREFIRFLFKYRDQLPEKTGNVLGASMIVISRRVQSFDSIKIVNDQDKEILLDLAKYWEEELNTYF